jgi:hypothetical protein
MRAAFMLALRRESAELEQQLIERRIEEAYRHVYEYLEPAYNYLYHTTDEDGRRALDVIEEAYIRALEVAARSGIGSQAVVRDDTVLPSRRAIPTASVSPYAPAAPAETPGDDTVIWMRPIG